MTTNELAFIDCDADVQALVRRYVASLRLEGHALRVTSSRAVYGRWLGRTIPSRYGGAYCYLRREHVHAVLIHLDRIDRSQPYSLEIVVVEELLHMRDHLDGDHRRHAKHGYDRIAHRVARIVGVSLEDVRSALLPPQELPRRYIYECPECRRRIARKRKGAWSCRHCSPNYDPRFALRLIEDRGPARQVSGDVQ